MSYAQDAAKNSTLNMRIDGEVRDALQRAADADDRSLSYVAHKVLAAWARGEPMPARTAVARELGRREDGAKGGEE